MGATSKADTTGAGHPGTLFRGLSGHEAHSAGASGVAGGRQQQLQRRDANENGPLGSHRSD